jgi:hypothetical protein
MSAPALVLDAGASPTGNGLYDLDLAVGASVEMPDEDDAIGAGVRVIMISMILSRWVRGLRGRLIHVNTSSVLAAPPGD